MVLLQVDQNPHEQSTFSSESPKVTPALTSNAIQPGQSRPQRVRKNTYTYKTWWSPGYLQLETVVNPRGWQDGDHGSNEECNTTTQWRLVPASWLRPRHLLFDFVGNSWKYSFKLARTVPFGSEIFHACWDGDEEMIMELFNLGSATINDVLPNGENLLHVRLFPRSITKSPAPTTYHR